MNRISIIAAFAVSILAACETVVDEAPPPVVVEVMSETQFSSALRSANADTNPFSGEQKLTALVNNNALSADQRGRALYARAQLRWKKTFDKAGAKSDFDEYARLYPSATFANNSRIESGYVQTELSAAQSRLQGLQTLRDWFDDTWTLGKRDEAAARYRRSGLTPEPHQVYQLQSTGYLCQGSGAKKLHNYGPVTTEIQNLFWCR